MHNASYERHRGFYWKDATGRWRTPDGRVVPGQGKEDVQTRDGKVENVYVSDKAWHYNQRRHERLLVNDTVNLARAAGVDVSVAEARDEIRRASREGVSQRRQAIELLLRKAEAQGKSTEAGVLLAGAAARKWRLGGSA